MEKAMPTFFLVNDNGVVVSYWTVKDSGAAFCLRDDKKNPRLHLDVNKNGEPTILLMKEKKEGVAFFGWNARQGVHLMLRSGQGESAVMLGQARKGMALGITDEKKTPRLMLGTQDQGLPRISLGDCNGRLVASLAVQDDAPALIMQKKPGSRLVASTLPDGEAYVSIARDDAIVWKQPADLGLPAGPVLPDDILDGLMDR